MVTLIILCILSAILNIALFRICQTKYRDEDARGIADGRVKIKSTTKHLPQTSWVICTVLLIIAAICYDNPEVAIVLVGLVCVITLLFILIAAFHRNSYYAIDDKGLSYIKHGNLEWSHSWNEIDHAKKRVVSTGKSFIILYDIETKDGVKHRSLPSSLKRDLEEHTFINKRIDKATLLILLALIIIVGIFIAFGIAANS